MASKKGVKIYALYFQGARQNVLITEKSLRKNKTSTKKGTAQMMRMANISIAGTAATIFQ
jgi:hypothetical protein